MNGMVVAYYIRRKANGFQFVTILKKGDIMLRKRFFPLILAAAFLLIAGSAMAATSVSWISPSDGTSYNVGDIVNPTGQASATGTTGGTGLDLALVLDSSGSMRSNGRQQAQKDAANALVDALPPGTTSVTIIEYDSDANTVRTLLALASATNIDLIHAAINATNASGGTDIRDGINQATSELTSVRADASRSQMMVVLSDGGSNLHYARSAAATAMGSGIEAIHTVGISSSHSVTTMQGIVAGADGIYGNADDYGVYTDGTNLSSLTGIFDGTGGNLVGLHHINVELADGTMINDIAFDGLGNFVLPDQVIALGANSFTAYAYGTDGTDAVATLTLNGTGGPAPVPEPATMLLLGTGLAGLIVMRRKKKN
jgi:hypothetical protein